MPSLDEVRAETMERLRAEYPRLAQHSSLLNGVADADAYAEWRRSRCHDHSVVFLGAQMPDGSIGFAIYVFEKPDERMSTGVRFTEEELRELRDQIDRALEATQ